MASSGGFRYGPWDGGPDPLASPYDAPDAIDDMTQAVLNGATPREALEALQRRGAAGRKGLDELRQAARRRRQELRRSGRLDGTLQEVRRLLDEAVEAEHSALFADPSDDARMREAELAGLPEDTARAVRALADYEWRSSDAAAAYAELRDLLRREVLDTRFQGMKQSLEGADAAAMQAVKDMLSDLNDLLDAHNRGEDTERRLHEFLDKHGDVLGERPGSVDELIDTLARRSAAAAQMMASLTPEQRAELDGLMSQTLADLDLQAQMARLDDALRAARPDLDWSGRRRAEMQGDEGLGMGDATTVLAEMADLEEVAEALGQGYAGANLDDIDPEQVERALGRGAVDDLRALRDIERRLSEQGFLSRDGDALALTPKAMRRIGAAALRTVFEQMSAPRRGEHDVRDAGSAGEVTGASRAWEFGDEQPIDVVRTLRNAVARGSVRTADGRRQLQLSVSDFEVVETERRSKAAVCLLVDLSYSMLLRGTWGTAKATALALHSLATSAYPQDAIHIIGFSDYAREISPLELTTLGAQQVQGTNLQHALHLAGRILARHPDAEQIVLVVTDGEPTAHLEGDGESVFFWPPLPETLELTMAEVVRLTRRGVTINVFMLDDEPRLVRFVEEVARRNGGRVLTVDGDQLGQHVVRDYLRSRRGR